MNIKHQTYIRIRNHKVKRVKVKLVLTKNKNTCNNNNLIDKAIVKRLVRKSIDTGIAEIAGNEQIVHSLLERRKSMFIWS